jgi:MFS transporter, UMF1 family
VTRSTSIWRRDILGWSLYDFANTIYSMNIVSLYLKRYIVEDLNYDDRWFDIPFSLSMAFAALLLPALGAMSDYTTKKKLFVLLFTIACSGAIGLLAVVPPAMIFATVVLFVIANFSYEAAQPFYNALLYSVADGARARYISGVGVAFGYVGSVVGMVLVLPFVTGGLFSLEIPLITGGGKVAAFVPTAILFLLFTLPLVFWVHERPVQKKGKPGLVRAYRDVYDGVVQTKKYPGVLRFLIADYCFEDAVMTVIINIGLYCSIVLSLDDTQINAFLIISTISAVAGSLVIGKIAQFWSLKRLIQLIVIGWIICLLLFVVTDNMAVVWVIGSVVGILLGGLWTTTRPMLAELVPRSELGRFFGLFALSGRAAAVIGPLLWTTVVYLFNSERAVGRATARMLDLTEQQMTALPYKAGILSLVVMMALGLYIFRNVRQPREDRHE